MRIWGLLRNGGDEFLHGFVTKLEEGDASSAELWACVHGLDISWEMAWDIEKWNLWWVREDDEDYQDAEIVIIKMSTKQKTN